MANEALAIDAQGNRSAFWKSVVQCPSRKSSFCLCASWRALSIVMLLAGGCRNLAPQSSSRPFAPSSRFEKCHNRRKQRIKLMLVESFPERRS